MNLKHLFELQRKLDEHIVKEKGLEGQDLLPKKILALQVELGELANEWRGFKFWSEDQEPKTHKFKLVKSETEHGEVVIPTPYNPLLEEYVDCLHFILSIGLDINVDTNINYGMTISRDVTEQFFEVYRDVLEVKESVEFEFDGVEKYRDLLVPDFLGLGKMLGFTWEQIEQAYLAKNKINHLRQESGY